MRYGERKAPTMSGNKQIQSKLENTKELLPFFRHNNDFAVTF